MAAVRRPLVHRLASLALLAAWLTPGAIALGLGVHLDLHHGTPPAEWALAVEHGHSHAAADPEHEHSGTRAEAARAALDPMTAGVTGDGPPALAIRERRPAPEPSRPLRPPRPALFTLHCALLC